MPWSSCCSFLFVSGRRRLTTQAAAVFGELLKQTLWIWTTRTPALFILKLNVLFGSLWTLFSFNVNVHLSSVYFFKFQEKHRYFWKKLSPPGDKEAYSLWLYVSRSHISWLSELGGRQALFVYPQEPLFSSNIYWYSVRKVINALQGPIAAGFAAAKHLYCSQAAANDDHTHHELQPQPAISLLMMGSLL